MPVPAMPSRMNSKSVLSGWSGTWTMRLAGGGSRPTAAGAIAPALGAVTGGAGLGVDLAPYSERLRVGWEWTPVSRSSGIPELRRKDDAGSDHKHCEAGGHDRQAPARVPAAQGNPDGEQHESQHGELYSEEKSTGVRRRVDGGTADASARGDLEAKRGSSVEGVGPTDGHLHLVRAGDVDRDFGGKILAFSTSLGRQQALSKIGVEVGQAYVHTGGVGNPGAETVGECDGHRVRSNLSRLDIDIDGCPSAVSSNDRLCGTPMPCRDATCRAGSKLVR